MRLFKHLLRGSLLALFGLVSLRAEDKVIVHEWGTFTSLQDEHGQSIGGINVDDEPVPGFVCQYANRLVAAQYSREANNFGLPPYNSDSSKGWTTGDPTVTMRLETPVVYLYPPKGRTPQSVPPLDVHVDFYGGVLSQYYPNAQTNGVSLNGDIPYLEKAGITESMTTGLTWKGVRLGSTEKPVETEDKVWTTPREVSAPVLEVPWPTLNLPEKKRITLAEHFLFYRGVGHLDSPIFVAPCGAGKKGEMELASPSTPRVRDLASAWIVEIRPNGSCAARHVEDNRLLSDTQFPIKVLHAWSDVSGFSWFTNFSAAFADSDFRPDNLRQLKASMQAALIKEGLYPDEASAMLRTWDLSYFKSPGLRFFYIVPRAWVDKVLPLKITGAPTDITRVMIGRIELITDAQKAALARLAAGPCPDLAEVKNAANQALEKKTLSNEAKEAFYHGKKPLSDLGIPLPPLVQDYLSLGRFRDALIVHEAQQHPSPALAQFIKDNQLAPPVN